MGCKPLEKSKIKQKKGLWSPDEDQKLRDYIMNHGHGSWSSLPINAGLQRNGKSCRLRWINYLRPGLRRGNFTLQEEETVLTLHGKLGNKWSQIVQHLPGRTDNEIKNYWHSYLKKKLAKTENVQDQTRSTDHDYTSLKTNNVESSSSSSLNSLGHMEGSSTYAANQLVPKCSNVPKILFADWFSLDQFHCQELSNSSQQTVLANESNTEFQDSFEFVHQQLFGSDDNIYQGLSDGSAADNMIFQPQLKFEDQTNLESELIDIISGNNNMCSDNFDMNDVMYI